MIKRQKIVCFTRIVIIMPQIVSNYPVFYNMIIYAHTYTVLRLPQIIGVFCLDMGILINEYCDNRLFEDRPLS